MPKTPRAAGLPFIVKVCGITTEDDLEIAIEAGANAVGFNFYPKSPRYLTPARAKTLSGAVPSHCTKVGVFVNPSEDELMDITALVPLDVLQLHGEPVPPNWAVSFRVWQGGNAAMSRRNLDPNVEAWLLDTPTPLYGGSGHRFDWSLAAGFPRRFIVAGGLDSSNVADAIHSAQPWGVDACSRLESAPGKKDPALVQAFVEAALAAFRLQQAITI
jgi:phosphoribosylanthranilate isomerase